MQTIIMVKDMRDREVPSSILSLDAFTTLKLVCLLW